MRKRPSPKNKKKKALPPVTARNIIHAAAKRFARAGLSYGHGTNNAFDEAAWLVLETLGLPLENPGARVDRPLTQKQRQAVEEVLAARIKTRTPAAYLLNRAYIQGIPFYVDERVIVPRSFIGELMFSTERALLGKPSSVLDLCTGSGCLAILAALLFPSARVDAVDLSADALEVAKINVRKSGFGRRISLFRGDLFAPLGKRKYDLILTNPPYVDAAAMKKLPPEYRCEPEMALASGRDGLDLVRRILKEAPSHLNKGGVLVCEIGHGKKALEKACPRLPFLWLDTETSEGEVFLLTKEQLR